MAWHDFNAEYPSESSSGYGPSWLQLITEPLENLRLLGRRAVLALLGIAVGCMAVVALLNIGYNARVQAMSVFKGMGSDLLIASIQLPVGYSGGAIPSITRLNTGVLHRYNPGITAVAPLISVNIDARLKGHTLNVTALGSGSELSDVMDLQLAKGRFLSRYDTQGTYAVVGAKVITAWKALGVRVDLGDRIQLGSYLYEIIGILKPNKHNPLLPAMVNMAIILPAERMQRIIPAPQISSVMARNPGDHAPEQTAHHLQQWLKKEMPGFDVNVQIPQQLIDGIAQQSRLFSWLLVGLGGIALLVGGIGVMNVMVMNISERRREIGVRMSLGARPRDIALMFLLESVVLATLGAVTGASMGLVVSWIFVHYSGWSSFSLSAISLPLGVGSAMATGLFFGLSPAITASRLSPVQALRDE
ncbi:ABC transporter permease [Enterobacteriaceae bacterium H11S18]|uniref:ABC transporter permease n=1 Tax=Dryocola clanedunensis TaxID=2925396 RepID=UPI0022F04530|nr:ABC transporter permease [Dryocola clanedunensis]MCT4708827.1 ABC transporter permease [Dryocola clanedunensis]